MIEAKDVDILYHLGTGVNVIRSFVDKLIHKRGYISTRLSTAVYNCVNSEKLSTDELFHNTRLQTFMTTGFFEVIHTRHTVQSDLITRLWIVDKDVRVLSKKGVAVEKVFHSLRRRGALR
jgi:hypothetical protein